jgi:hypothetical protein
VAIASSLKAGTSVATIATGVAVLALVAVVAVGWMGADVAVASTAGVGTLTVGSPTPLGSSVVAGAGFGAKACVTGPIKRMPTISRMIAGKINWRQVTGTKVDASEAASSCP